MTKIPHQIAQLFLSVNFNADTYRDGALLPLIVPLALNQTTLVCVKRHYVMKPVCRR